LRRLGNEVRARTAIDPTAIDDEGQLEAVANRDPEAIVFAGPREAGTEIIATLGRLGLSPRDVPVFVSDGMRIMSPAASSAAAAAEDLDGVQGTSLAAAVSSSVWFRDALAVSAPEVANLYASYAYDCTNLIALAGQAMGTDDASHMRDAMVDVSSVGTTCRNFVECTGRLALGNNIDLDGASGPIEFAANGDPQWGTFDLFRFGADGQDVTERQLLVRARAA
jgi:branched-chain amino acid transport system substrate-binding protein